MLSLIETIESGSELACWTSPMIGARFVIQKSLNQPVHDAIDNAIGSVGFAGSPPTYSKQENRLKLVALRSYSFS
ncbi:MAG: hypothetical protein L3J98_10570 [Gammaproteobacteria bacterium]|nr:hypothetical protein [Gammaproteobacteria bacterium]MCF6260581.1 hypothetical protein [Gammaproteobacteria bacterium]